MTEEFGWRPIPGYKGYLINEFGEVLDGRGPFDKNVDQYRIGNMVVVNLVADNMFRPHAVSMDTLMVDNFIERPARTHLYDLVHIDGDDWNCRADNYGWRRKWIPMNARNDG